MRLASHVKRPLDGYMQKMEPRLKVCEDHMGILLDKLEMCYYVFLSTQLDSFWTFFQCTVKEYYNHVTGPPQRSTKARAGSFQKPVFLHMVQM